MIGKLGAGGLQNLHRQPPRCGHGHTNRQQYGRQKNLARPRLARAGLALSLIVVHQMQSTFRTCQYRHSAPCFGAISSRSMHPSEWVPFNQNKHPEYVMACIWVLYTKDIFKSKKIDSFKHDH